MRRFKKYSVITLVSLLLCVMINGTYWLLSDIQMRCYDKVYKHKQDLNFYEKCSIYSLHLGICCFGWPLSPEATRQELYCTIPSDGIMEWHSYAFNKSKTIEKFKKKPYTKKWLYWNVCDYHDGYVDADYLSISTYYDLRCALAVNGSYIYKEGDQWKITFKNNEFKYPHIPIYTKVGPFKFHESLFRYLQEIGWMHTPKIVWVL